MKYILFLLLIVSCQNNNKHSKNLNSLNKETNCINDSTLYTSINKNLLYKDSLGEIYLKVKNEIIDDSKNTISECQKLPFIYLKEVVLVNDSIANISDIITVNSFHKLNNSMYYSDENRIYALRTNPVTYPPFFEINLNAKNIKVLDSLSITDGNSKFINGEKL